MKVLVTGGAGSIGTYVVRALLSRGDEVVIVDDFNDFYDPELKRARLAALLHGFQMPEIIECDIREEKKLGEIFARVKPVKVIHLAAWAAVRPSVENPLLYTQVNVDGTVNVFQESVKNGVENIVFASSSSVYGRNLVPPYSEDVPCDMPIAPYAASKRTGELYGWMYHYLHKLPIACLRFFTVYGPWIRPDMATWRFTERIDQGKEISLNKFAVDGSEVKRDFTYVDDIVAGILASLDRNKAFDIINLGNNDPVALTRFVKAIENGIGKEAKIVERQLPAEEAIATAADLTHAKEVLGYAPTTSIEQGIANFTAWYKGEYKERFPEGIAKSPYWS